MAGSRQMPITPQALNKPAPAALASQPTRLPCASAWHWSAFLVLRTVAAGFSEGVGIPLFSQQQQCSRRLSQGAELLELLLFSHRQHWLSIGI